MFFAMRRVVPLLLVLLCFLPFRLEATVWTPDNLPMVHLQDVRRYVCNPDGVLSPAAVDSADAMLRAIEQEKGVESVVVVVRRLEGGDPYEFGITLGRKYGVGDREKRTGLVVVLSTEDRAYYILTGYGLEATLPDAICRRVENRVMVPRLKQGDWDGAVVETVRALCALIRGDASLVPDKAGADDDESPWMALPVAIVFLVFMGLIFGLANRHNPRRCPKCRHYDLQPVSSKRYRDAAGRWKKQTVWRCAHCGYTEIRDEDAPPPGVNAGDFFPPFFIGGGLGRGFGSGGGFSGGSFGGGGFGGGGAGGRF